MVGITRSKVIFVSQCFSIGLVTECLAALSMACDRNAMCTSHFGAVVGTSDPTKGSEGSDPPRAANGTSNATINTAQRTSKSGTGDAPLLFQGSNHPCHWHSDRHWVNFGTFGSDVPSKRPEKQNSFSGGTSIDELQS